MSSNKNTIIEQAMWLGFLILMMLIMGVTSVLYNATKDETKHQKCCECVSTK